MLYGTPFPPQQNGDIGVSLLPSILKRDKHHTVGQGLSSHCFFSQTLTRTHAIIQNLISVVSFIPDMALCAKNTPISEEWMGMCIELYFNVLQFFLSFHSKMERRDVTILGDNVHMWENVNSASSCHDFGTFLGTAISLGHCPRPYHFFFFFLKWIYYEQHRLWTWNCQNSYFALENRLLNKRPWGFLASPSPWLEGKISRVMKTLRKDWTYLINLVKKISEGWMWWVGWLINICSHFSHGCSWVEEKEILFIPLQYKFLDSSTQQSQINYMHFREQYFFLKWADTSKRLDKRYCWWWAFTKDFWGFYSTSTS